jgi:SHS2 domain-containing protein
VAPSRSDAPAPAAWEHFAHVADVGVRGFGDSMAQAFAQAALALTAAITDPSAVRQRQAVEIACAAPDAEILLADWLNALVFEMATRNMLFSRFDVVIEGNCLAARAYGEKVDVARHQPATEVKGATLSELRVARDEDGRWRAQCVVDV